MRVARVIVVISVVALLATGCSGGSKKGAAPSAFADATCVDLAAWATQMQPAFADLQSLSSIDPSNPAAAKDQLKKVSSELAAAEQATTKLADGIDSRPAPNIASGDNVKKTIVDTLRRLIDVGHRTRTEIDAYDPASATPAQTQQLKTDLDGLTSQAGESLSGLAPLFSSNPELQSAFANSATCKQAGSNLSS